MCSFFGVQIEYYYGGEAVNGEFLGVFCYTVAIGFLFFFSFRFNWLLRQEDVHRPDILELYSCTLSGS